MRMDALVGASPAPALGEAPGVTETAARLRGAAKAEPVRAVDAVPAERPSDGQVEAYTKLGLAAPVSGRPEATFRQVDVNGDGGLSADEMRHNSAKVAEVLDRNLTPEMLIEQLDRDRDGKVGQGESSTGVEVRAGREGSDYQKVV